MVLTIVCTGLEKAETPLTKWPKGLGKAEGWTLTWASTQALQPVHSRPQFSTLSAHPAPDLPNSSADWNVDLNTIPCLFRKETKPQVALLCTKHQVMASSCPLNSLASPFQRQLWCSQRSPCLLRPSCPCAEPSKPRAWGTRTGPTEACAHNKPS